LLNVGLSVVSSDLYVHQVSVLVLDLLILMLDLQVIGPSSLCLGPSGLGLGPGPSSLCLSLGPSNPAVGFELVASTKLS